ncbi:MAG TPA: hypothetical protein VM842_07505 [Nitrospira sp.]|nr:hypothetical protein [Nitrospira sp.]
MRTEKRRINTQMPRRTKIRTATPMASEWDIDTGLPPSGLRTPSDKMMPASRSIRVLLIDGTTVKRQAAAPPARS